MGQTAAAQSDVRYSAKKDWALYDDLRSRIEQRNVRGLGGRVFGELDLIAGLSAGLEREGTVLYRSARRNGDANGAIAWEGAPVFPGGYVSSGLKVRAADGAPGFMTVVIPSRYLSESPTPAEIAKAYRESWRSWNLRNWVNTRPTGLRMTRGALNPV